MEEIDYKKAWMQLRVYAQNYDAELIHKMFKIEDNLVFG